jgi:hypothetical protein
LVYRGARLGVSVKRGAKDAVKLGVSVGDAEKAGEAERVVDAEGEAVMVSVGVSVSVGLEVSVGVEETIRPATCKIIGADSGLLSCQDRISV